MTGTKWVVGINENREAQGLLEEEGNPHLQGQVKSSKQNEQVMAGVGNGDTNNGQKKNAETTKDRATEQVMDREVMNLLERFDIVCDEIERWKQQNTLDSKG